MKAAFTLFALLARVSLVQFANCAAIVLFVTNGSDITINLTAENSQNRLVNVITNSGNNNPSIFDWIGGNGANKAPRVSIGSVNQPAADENPQSNSITDALRTTGDAALQGIMEADSSNSAELDSAEIIDVVSSTTEKLNGSSMQSPFDGTTEQYMPWKRKYVTVEMKRSDFSSD
ncbi:uncharacterized protein LOC129723303 isoform X2 [Wyeomyia smithii]|uniref:uncharacterized protein LOC129723303 isoform X2 n=1 Tax=Wyeomyia smithii TaxID=174621 RepID=UPI0024681994|nr:uncharacterized protein LOC129723303 isoform X2 [Wyeomyia smithii]